MKKTLLSFIGAFLFFAGCERENETKTTSIEGTWKITTQTGIYILGTDTTIDDSYSQMDSCIRDDMYHFNADKTITLLSGATKCDPNENESEPIGTWDLTNNNKQLSLNFDASILTAEVSLLTANILKIVTSDHDSLSSYTIYTTYTRQ